MDKPATIPDWIKEGGMRLELRVMTILVLTIQKQSNPNPEKFGMVIKALKTLLY